MKEAYEASVQASVTNPKANTATGLALSLYMHLLDLDGRITRGAAADPELTGRLRALTSELGHLGDAMGEVEQLLLQEPTLEVTPR